MRRTKCTEREWPEAGLSSLGSPPLQVLDCAAEQLAWAAGGGGGGSQRCWRGAAQLLLHRHLWVRKAAGRLVGGGLAAPDVAGPMLAAGDDLTAGERGACALPAPCWRALLHGLGGGQRAQL